MRFRIPTGRRKQSWHVLKVLSQYTNMDLEGLNKTLRFLKSETASIQAKYQTGYPQMQVRCIITEEHYFLYHFLFLSFSSYSFLSLL